MSGPGDRICSSQYGQKIYTGTVLVDLQKAFNTFHKAFNFFVEKLTIFGFQITVIKWFEFYSTSRKFFCLWLLKRFFSETERSNYGVSQRSVLRLHPLPLHENVLLRSFSETDFYLHAHDTCISLKHGYVSKIGIFLNKELSLLCEWFIQSELSIHFRSNQDQDKCILFSMVKVPREINIFFAVYCTKQHDTIEFLSCQFDSKLSGKAMVSEVMKKTQEKLKFFSRQSKYPEPVAQKCSVNKCF